MIGAHVHSVRMRMHNSVENAQFGREGSYLNEVFSLQTVRGNARNSELGKHLVLMIYHQSLWKTVSDQIRHSKQLLINESVLGGLHLVDVLMQ